MPKDIPADLKGALLRYVNAYGGVAVGIPYSSETDGPKIEQLIKDHGITVEADDPNVGTVYRAQKESDTVLDVVRGTKGFLSTSKTESPNTSVMKTFAGPKCCVFRIKLEPGTRYVDVYTIIDKGERGYRGEEEILVLTRGGEFSKPELDKTERIADKKTFDVTFTPPEPTTPPKTIPSSSADAVYKIYFDLIRGGLTIDNLRNTEEYKALSPSEKKKFEELVRKTTVVYDYGDEVGGKRRTRRFRKRRLMSRKYCKKTPCRKMGFTQKASCRPYKNCFTRKVRR